MKNIFSDDLERFLPELAEAVELIIENKRRKGQSCDVFVVIPFTEDMDPIFEGVREASRTLGLSATRVKDVVGDIRITETLLAMIRGAKVIIADITHEKPNVYFELGYARGIGKEVVTIARHGTTIHFDVKDWPCIFYNDSRTLERHLVARLTHLVG